MHAQVSCSSVARTLMSRREPTQYVGNEADTSVPPPPTWAGPDANEH